jgi:hypothetical protein
MLQDVVNVRILSLQELVEPVHGFHVGVAAHLTKDSGTLDGFIADAIKLAEESGAFDFSHNCSGMSG